MRHTYMKKRLLEILVIRLLRFCVFSALQKDFSNIKEEHIQQHAYNLPRNFSTKFIYKFAVEQLIIKTHSFR